MKTIINICCVIVFLFVNLQSVHAESISLDKAMELGILNNPTLKVARARLGISDAQILQASLRINPSLVTDNGVAEKTYRFIGVEQIFELGGKRVKRTKLARIKKDVVMSEISTTLLDIRSNIRTSYIQLYNAQQRLVASQDILATTTKLSEVAKKRQLAGDIAVLDVLQAEIIMVKAKNDIQKAKLEVNQSFNALTAYMGQNLDRNIQLETPVLLAEFNNAKSMPKEQNEQIVDSFIEQAYSSRPEVKAILKNIEAENQRIVVAKANINPNLKLAVGPDMVLPGGEENNNLNLNVFAVGSLELPVFNRQQGIIKEAIAQRQQYEKELEATKIKITQEVNNAYAGIINNAESIRIYEDDLIPRAKDILEKSKLSFLEGKSNILVSLNSQEAYINTRLGYIQTLTEYEKSVSDLERAIGAGQ